jgi:YbgC/YbaW family acyl-CoA thioester hydrolase
MEGPAKLVSSVQPHPGVPCARTVQTVGMVDVDVVQINFATYFRWMDLGYGALLRMLGHPLSTILARGNATPAVDARCQYLTPVSLDDRVDCASWIAEAGRSSYTVAHRFELEGTLVAEGQLAHVWISTSPAVSAPLPAWLRSAAALPKS